MPANVDTDFLFPVPSSPPSTLSPYHWPGISPESTRALKDVLSDNHKRWHIFFNDKGFHNHTAHRAIAIWSLGADTAVIRAAYERDLKEQRLAFKSPEPITEDNYEKHLGDERYYDAYVDFFTDRVRKEGTDKIFETFILSRKYNSEKMEMLSRFLAGLIHPMIHTGYWAEFGLPGLLVEGIAQSCVHPPDVHGLLPKSFFDSIYAMSDAVSAITPNFAATSARKIEQIAARSEPGKAVSLAALDDDVHALTVLARVMTDSRLSPPDDPDESTIIQSTIARHSHLIQQYAAQWVIDLHRTGEIERKVEEITWMNVVMYGIAGWTWAQQVKQGKEGEFNADFYLMHLVTSVAFIPSLLARISHSPHSQIILLRSYFAVSLSWYIARARPKLDVRAFFTSSTATSYPLPISALPTPHKDALPGQDKVQTCIPDPWLPLVSTTVVHQDEHLAKIVRTLASWASKLGSTPAGTFGGPENPSDMGRVEHSAESVARKCAIRTELPGAEFLDGTLFIRVAGLTVARLGRVGQGETPAEFWDLTGFYEDPEVAEKMKPS